MLILMTLTLHRMVWRDADADDDARSSRRGLPIEQGAALPPHRACRCTGWRGALVVLAAVHRDAADVVPQDAGPARAQGCLAPRAAGRKLALGAAVWLRRFGRLWTRVAGGST